MTRTMPEYTDKPLIVWPGPTLEAEQKTFDPERRAAFRFPCTATAKVTEPRSKTSLAGRSADLGLGGCYIDTISPFSMGATVQVRLEHGRYVFEAEAVVAYAHTSMGMGLAFTNIKPEYQTVLHKWVAELSGEQLSEPEASPAEPEAGLSPAMLNLREALTELVNLMVRKKFISDPEGAAIMRQIFH